MKKVTINLEQFGNIDVNAMILDPNYRENYGYVKPIEKPKEIEVIVKDKPRKAKRVSKQKQSTKTKPMNKRGIEKKEVVSKVAARKEKTFKTIPVNTGAMIAVKIDAKTTVYAKDAADVERIKAKYAKKD